jgi:putative peptidoglycan lipid II flippase
MVGRVLTLINQEVRGLHEAAYLLGLFAILSQVLALVRDRLLAASFGAGSTLDVYYAAFRIPDVIFVGIASIVSVYVLIPFLAEKEAISKNAEREFLSRVFSAFTLAITVVSIAVFLAIPWLSKMLFPGFLGTPLYDELVLLTRILLLQPLLLGISNLFGSVTQTRQRFILYALSPILYNVGIVFGVLFLYPIYGIMGLGFGVILGALFHLAIQLPFIILSGSMPHFTPRIFHLDVKRVVLLSLPRTLGLSAHQIALLVLVSLASSMAVGSITVFNFAFNLQSVPFAIIGISYSVAAFPTLARLFSNGERSKFLEHILLAVRHIIFWSLPAIAFFVVLRAQIVRVILGTGSFDWVDTRLTAAALALFIFSLVAQGIVLLFVRGYYAAGNTIKPLIANTLSAVLAVIFALALLRWFEASVTFRFFIESLLRVEDLPGTAVLMLPLGYSLALILNAIALWFIFMHDFDPPFRPLVRTLTHSFVAATVLGIVAHQALDIFDDTFDINTFLGIFLQGFLAGVLGILAAIAILVILGNSEVKEAWQTLHRKFWKRSAIAPPLEEL